MRMYCTCNYNTGVQEKNIEMKQRHKVARTTVK